MDNARCAVLGALSHSFVHGPFEVQCSGDRLSKSIPPEVLERFSVERRDFEQALKEMQPSALREIVIEIPYVSAGTKSVV
jgi:SpoVK/Ycf46/Vps4 family AAA+-type ATPase